MSTTPTTGSRRHGTPYYPSSAVTSCILKVVREVKNKLEMILLGLQAGGIGLSLTAANRVPLLLDLACISLPLLRHSCHP